MTLQPKTQEVYDFLKVNGKTSMDELVEKLGRSPRSISGSLTSLKNRNFADRITENDVKYAFLTEEGLAFVPSEEE